MTQRFVHLHLHSEYSLLDGGMAISRLVERVGQLGMDAVALTDHGNLHGAVEFYRKAKAAGIKPILGIEAYVAPDVNGSPGDRTKREFTGIADGGLHLVLLAQNNIGWQNLLKLSTDAFLNGFYYRPRMDKSTLARWSDGLIAINGHLGSSVAHFLTQYVQTNDPKHFDAALAEARWYAQTFGPDDNGQPRFYIELQRHGDPQQQAIEPHLIALARQLDLPLVADNDAHFLTADDHDSHDTLICISTGKIKTAENRMRYSSELYVKSPQQMAELFSDLPEAIDNTARIADRCSVELDFATSHAPMVKIERTDSDASARHSEGSAAWYEAFCSQYELMPFDALADRTPRDQIKRNCDQALRELTEAGAIWRYGRDGITDDIRQRIDRELGILAEKNISAYFLIVWDFVNEARRRAIPVGTRGSAVGTMVGYCLGLSNACPVKYGLLFERFTDPDRSEYPDIDIDMCQDGRGQIIEYVRQKYGHVAQIITFGTLKARAAIRDVGRVLDVPLPEVDKVCKLIGAALGTDIDKALDQQPDLRELYHKDKAIHAMVNTARQLEGLCRHAGVHAGGVVIATQPLENIVPLYKPGSGDDLPVVTQWDGPTVDDVGLLKIDFLGLRTLSIIERARQLVRQCLDEQTIRRTIDPNGRKPADWDPLDLERLDYTDQDVLDLFRRGETAGVFQFESSGMRNLLMAMQPDRLEDLIAANALYRPGPMALIGDYNDRKHGRKAVPKVHAVVDRYTAETYGVMVYQEQVMQIVHELGDIPLRAVYTLIKAIGKKKRDVIDANRAKFVDGAQAKGLTEKQATELWELIMKFAGYGFNKSHSTGYSIVAYQTAYLKTYFPIQYMAAVLTYESVNTDKVVEYIDECRRVLLPSGRRGADVRPPDINKSGVAFTVVYDADEPRDASHSHIRFGLGAVKGVGEKAVAAIIEARDKAGPFKSLYDFAERVPLGAVNRATIEALIKCGAFDTIHGSAARAALLASLDDAVAAGHRAATDRSSGQMNFFETLGALPGDAAADLPEPPLAKTEPWSSVEQLRHEKDVLGFYVSSHPLHRYVDIIDRFATTTVADVPHLAADVEVILGCMFTRIRTTLTKTGRSAGQKMAMVTLEDATGPIDAVLFAETYAQFAPLLTDDQVVFVKGRVDRRREQPSIVISEVLPADQAADRLTRTVKIVLRDAARPDAALPFGRQGELAKLKARLCRLAGAHADCRAELQFEIHQNGRVVQLRASGLTVGVDRELPDNIATILGPYGRCELLGPPKLRVNGARRAPAADTHPTMPLFSDTGELCASIDRY